MHVEIRTVCVFNEMCNQFYICDFCISIDCVCKRCLSPSSPRSVQRGKRHLYKFAAVCVTVRRMVYAISQHTVAWTIFYMSMLPDTAHQVVYHTHVRIPATLPDCMHTQHALEALYKRIKYICMYACMLHSIETLASYCWTELSPSKVGAVHRHACTVCIQECMWK